MNAGTSRAAVARSSDVGMVTTTLPKTLTATLFTGASGSSSQPARYVPRGQRTFTPLYMPLSKALGVLIKKGHLKPLEPRPLPEKLPPLHNPAKYCAYHQQHGHETDQCFRLRHEIQDLIDNRVIMPSEKPNVTTNPLLSWRWPEGSARYVYDPSGYITPTGQPKLRVELLDTRDVTVNWFDLEGSAKATGWLSDELDVIEQPHPERGPLDTGTSTVARMAGDQNEPPEITGVKNFAQDQNDLSTEDAEQQAAPKQFEREKIEDLERARKAGAPVGIECAVSTRIECAVCTGTVVTKPDSCLSMADVMWWEDDDLCLAHTNEDWGNNRPDDTWYIGEVDHMTRSGQYFKPPHLDQPETSRKDKEAERQKEKLLEEETVLKQLKKIQVDISIWGLLMASRVHRQAVLSAMDRAKLSIDTTPEQLVGLVFPGGASPTLTFTDKELPPEGANHNKPLYISVECRDKWVPVVLVNIGFAINVCLSRMTYAIGLKPVDFVPTAQVIWAYDNTSREVMGTVQIRTKVGPGQHDIDFHVLDVPVTFNLLLGRPWLHQVKAVSSTLHQVLKYPHGKGVAIVFWNSSIHPPPEVSTPMLEIEHGAEDVFLSGFTLAEARVVQNILAIDEGLCVSAQSVYLMNKIPAHPRDGIREKWSERRCSIGRSAA
ncbi:hypothetical protein HYC85_029337 [Camellia sinensis]|uniref:Uncharacterized protein n=1 Tax=Camellia sinensis TaxID=4442 RepID=A0A7J7G1R9_CAMSI|nr:hypothetical protein HYC85_029337 [Camellia sinensis]